MARRTTKATAKKKPKPASKKVRRKRVKRAAAIKQLAKSGGTPRAKVRTRLRKAGAAGDEWR